MGARVMSKQSRVGLATGLGALCFSIGLAACGTYQELAPKAASVETTMSRPAGKCQSLGTLSGKGGGASGGYVSNESLIQYALNDLRNQASELGATHVLYSAPSLGGTGGTTTSAMVVGEALKCDADQTPPGPAAPIAPAPAPAAGGCQYDAQCKGERVCVKGECVDPKPASQPAAQSVSADGSAPAAH